MDRIDELVTGIHDALQNAADPARAPAQQAYMKSDLPFRGVRVPEVRRITRAQVRGGDDADVLHAAALALWDGARFREDRYAALAVLGATPLRGDLALVPTIEHVVRDGSWWDITDEVAHRVAELLDAHPVEMSLMIRMWSGDECLWMRRLAIIAQLGRRERLDRALLTDVVVANQDDGEFFIRKAIGWALRDAGRVDPAWVREVVATHALSPLSEREATRRL